MSELYRDYIDGKADEIINSLGGTITPAPANAELYRDFLDRKFDDVINAVDNVKIKSLTYTGNAQSSRDIVFPIKPTIILSIQGVYLSGWIRTDCIIWGLSKITSNHINPNSNLGAAVSEYATQTSFNDKTLTLSGNNSTSAMNDNNVVYTVYYI